MSKRKEKVSLAGLMGNREINPDEIENAATKVHTEKPEVKKQTPVKKEKVTRVSVDTPVSLYLKMKETALEEGIKSLRHFYLHCATEYLKSKGKL